MNLKSNHSENSYKGDLFLLQWRDIIFRSSSTSRSGSEVTLKTV